MKKMARWLIVSLVIANLYGFGLAYVSDAWGENYSFSALMATLFVLIVFPIAAMILFGDEC